MNIFFIGVGGISMSALAKICLNKGYNVFGSDSSDSHLLDGLRNQGATIYIGHKKEHITDDIDMVVYTAAVKSDNEELVAAREKNKLTMNRAAFLGQIMREYQNSVAVSGTHGKTSTTSMLSAIFEYADLDPTILVGGNLSIIGGNVKIGKSQNFITEACEYVDSFLNFNPKISIVLNIEEDHLDYFSGIDEIKASFNKFGKLLPYDGYFIINGDDENTKDILHEIKATVIKYGQKEGNNALIKDVKFNDEGHGIFSINYNGIDLGEFKLNVPGIHNIYNATGAILAALVSGVELETIRKNISLYGGVGRRFEIKGKYNNALVVDDYAHHPTELKATLSAAKKIKKNKLWCIFQPHTYTRTKSLLDEFSDAFYAADKVIITDIYAAREKDPGDIHSKDLVDKLYQNNVDVIYLSQFEDIAKYLAENITEDDLVITAGAGTVYKIGEMLLEMK
ncbi:UDP-N-acetylmuramate--L-alanine ligase,UDP-N-acetylmuramate--L-alanine ligase,UDP-N-acetylmuramate--L-alanine ligase,Folylpolyglutamate synthase,UDP-N-acetylmuramate--alanine ligase,Mur ligase middle domain [[Clostridium] sordellii]|uniref:UDP-N-acetylmuramate--L-alanine ligase n=1 Tax=Paraclostridium sordellii TaxID=1505 RepID=UPI000542DED9|nr:UDP-N-acetylmuramate--L-alanine ligase [Paeniclostridium sordellii]CEK36442.1 UDP-N-acetylmuramate--L-alanine ligase,UDP-N-acetylmuramate--L-alanine ligase,UDP-N-acetylmuramate--L-alanine ligase,Folylpolyglutamate synthase,UDP-N-acetylmuramate--alanine ligase,Mur ligase middle domain [[Clostridium] sordellii] [Paeniclostridium sordellii]